METINLVKAAAIAVTLAFTSLAAQAGELDNRVVTVRAYDLDLNKPADASALLRRVHQAVKHACKRIGDSHDLSMAAERSHCEKTSYLQSIATINSSQGIDVETIAAGSTSSREVAVVKK